MQHWWWLAVLGVGCAVSACSKSDSGGSEPACGACAAPNVCTDGQCVPPGGNTVLSGNFGTESGQFGVVDAEEAESEAPASLAVNAAGDRVYVLDQVNERVNVYAGTTVEREIAIGTPN